MKGLKKISRSVNLSHMIVIAFMLILLLLTFTLHMDSAALVSAALKRFGMNGFFALALLPGIYCGVGLNFGLPVGVVCGALAGVLTVQMNMTGFSGVFTAILLSIPMGAGAGWAYGKLLTKMQGAEMMIGNYVNFSIVSIMCLAWVYLPFTNPQILWPMGNGVRSTILLNDFYGNILDNFLAIHIGEKITIPTGTFLFFGASCFFVWLFFRTKTGIMIKSAGSNAAFAKSIGIKSDKTKIAGVVLSTTFAAVGYVIYAQSYGFYQLYTAPMMMAYPAIAAILIGGATPKKAKMTHVIWGTFVYQFIMVTALPVTSSLVDESNMTEILRMIISNGVILYALTKMDRSKV